MLDFSDDVYENQWKTFWPISGYDISSIVLPQKWKSVSINRIHKWVVSTWNIPENTSTDHCLTEFRVFEKLKNIMFLGALNFVRKNSYGFIFEWAKISIYSGCIEFDYDIDWLMGHLDNVVDHHVLKEIAKTVFKSRLKHWSLGKKWA